MAKKTPKSKSYLLDTSVILDDTDNLEHLWQNGENSIFISDVVLSELNKKKELLSETGFFAREFFRLINNDNGKEIALHDFKNAATLEGDYIRLMYLKKKEREIPIYIICRQHYRTKGLEHGLNDARIAEIAKDFNLILLTNDIALKIHSLSQGINAQSLYRDRVENPGEIDFWHTLNLHKDYDFSNLSKRKNFSELSDWSIIEVNEEDNTESSLYLTGKKTLWAQNRGAL